MPGLNGMAPCYVCRDVVQVLCAGSVKRFEPRYFSSVNLVHHVINLVKL